MTFTHKDSPRTRVVVCAANRYGDLIIPSARHHDPVMNNLIKILKSYGDAPIGRDEQGFIDQFGGFMTRQEALIVVQQSGQPFNIQRNGGSGKMLFSEGIY